MDQENVLERFTELLERYERHRGYIEKARAQAGKFSQAVIEKVCLDNELKSQEVAEELRPLVGSFQERMAAIDEEIEGIRSRTAESSERLEELELRQAIGELDPESFERESQALREEVGAAKGRIEELEEERSRYEQAIERWVEAARAAGHDTGLEDAGPEEQAEPVTGGEHAARVGMQEDVSAVFGGGASLGTASVRVPDDDEEEVAIEAADAGDDEGFSVDLAFGAVVEEEVSLEGLDGGEEAVVELDADAVEPAPPPSAGRKALLLRQEGTADEQVYTIQGDEVWIGRGRDNDIRVTGDSKVSRRHCRIYRKGDEFYIQDNKSSNGSLVNGEMITERRLFGGEEIIVGETFFRFRIMD